MGAPVSRLLFRFSHRLLPWLSQPLGHFYSPIGHPADLAARRAELWPREPRVTGIDFDRDGQRRLLRDVFPALLREFDYPAHDADPHRFHTGNSQFPLADARALFALLRHWRPARLVEVGSGYSTLLATDVNRRFLDGRMRIECIEPHPRDFLRSLPGLAALRIERVQDTPDAVFDALQAGDVLFVDSSHVVKTGSDVAWLLTHVLPRLRSGVRIHFHDVWLPDDYPPHWVIDLNRSWNEQYALQAILANGNRYRVLYGTQYALTRLAGDAKAAFPGAAGRGYAGGMFWIEVR